MAQYEDVLDGLWLAPKRRRSFIWRHLPDLLELAGISRAGSVACRRPQLLAWTGTALVVPRARRLSQMRRSGHRRTAFRSA